MPYRDSQSTWQRTLWRALTSKRIPRLAHLYTENCGWALTCVTSSSSLAKTSPREAACRNMSRPAPVLGSFWWYEAYTEEKSLNPAPRDRNRDCSRCKNLAHHLDPLARSPGGDPSGWTWGWLCTLLQGQNREWTGCHHGQDHYDWYLYDDSQAD